MLASELTFQHLRHANIIRSGVYGKPRDLWMASEASAIISAEGRDIWSAISRFRHEFLRHNCDPDVVMVTTFKRCISSKIANMIIASDLLLSALSMSTPEAVIQVFNEQSEGMRNATKI